MMTTPGTRTGKVTEPDASQPEGWVLYDGSCGVCARWVPFWMPTLARLGLAVAPLQAPWVVERLGLSPGVALTDIRLLLRDGRQLQGADVYRYAMRRLWWAYPFYLLAVTPGLRGLFDRAYRAFADHRFRISAACGLAPPEENARHSAPGATAPPRRRRAFLTAEWRSVVMLTYEIDPAILGPLVPAGTELDQWQGRTLVSVVGLRFRRTRVLGAAVPLHRDFDEVNLRFYVRRRLADGDVRRGVVFVRELVPRAAVAVLARLVYNEPYRVIPMRSGGPDSPGEAPGRLVYEWRAGTNWQRLAADRVGPPAVPAPGSMDAFVIEHYWGYTRQRGGGTVEYEVAHPAWRVWAAVNPVLDADVRDLDGERFAQVLAGPPTSALVAEGSPVTVYAPRRLTRGLTTPRTVIRGRMPTRGERMSDG
jgi:uncharacterized protein YqjF (DUF2071 family)/predicted DCC family thiol-disulfide oxidoreductase YuxK